MALVRGSMVGGGLYRLNFKVFDKCGFGASGFPVAPVDGSGARGYGG